MWEVDGHRNGIPGPPPPPLLLLLLFLLSVQQRQWVGWLAVKLYQQSGEWGMRFFYMQPVEGE